MKATVQIEPLSMGKALACTNFVLAILVLVGASLSGMKMTGVTWNGLMIMPFVLALAGLMYGLVGGTIYNAMARKKEAGIVIQGQ